MTPRDRRESGWVTASARLLVTLAAGIAACASWADECADWSSRCADLQGFRRARAESTGSAEPPRGGSRPGCATPAGGASLNGAAAGLVACQTAVARTRGQSGFDPVRFEQCLRGRAQEVERHRLSDLEAMLEEMRALRITEIAPAEIASLLTDPNSTYNQYKRSIRDTRLPLQAYYRDYTLSGPLQAFDEALTGRAGPHSGDSDEPRPIRFRISALAQLSRIGDARQVFEFLVRRAREAPQAVSTISPREEREAITPFVARMILFEIIRSRTGGANDRLERLLSRMRLKFNFRAPHLREDGFARARDYSLHDGYFLGSWDDLFPRGGHDRPSSGYDCTTLIQACLSEAGMSFSWGFKLLSEPMTALGTPEAPARIPASDLAEYQRNFEITPLRCEAQLRPGDIVAVNGHAFVIDGYERDASGRMQLRTFEAVGGEHRAVGRFWRELYPAGGGGSCGSPLFSQSGITRANIIRPR